MWPANERKEAQVSWFGDVDEDDDDGLPPVRMRVRPNPKANRPRTKRRPAHESAQIARVLGVDRGRYTVLVREGRDDESGVIATRARELRKTAIVTGDSARNRRRSLRRHRQSLCRIVGLEDRTSLLRRAPNDTDQVERVIVANADQMLLVVAAADPVPRPRLVDRYLTPALRRGAAAADGDLETKTDLSDPSAFLEHFSVLADLRVFLSSQDEPPVDEIGASLVGRTTACSSGTPASASPPARERPRAHAHRATGHVNEVTGRGRHTSSSTVSLRYISDAGSGWVIDTPGVRSFGLGHVDPENILRAYPDLAAVAEECPRGCSHLPDAPDCALNEAVEAGALPAARLDSLQRLLATFEGRTDW